MQAPATPASASAARHIEAMVDRTTSIPGASTSDGASSRASSDAGSLTGQFAWQAASSQSVSA